jgi:ADP-ribosylglycohydrolase
MARVIPSAARGIDAAMLVGYVAREGRVPSQQERLAGGLVGLLVGDALGVPYEFHAADQLPPLAEIEFDPPAGFSRAHRDVPPGTWSDDGAHALCLLASLLDRGALDLTDLGQRLLRWEQDGHLAVDGRVFDIGIQTSRALDALRRGVAPEDAGSCAESALGNGSLMRVLPLALWHRGGDDELVRDAMWQSRVTHGHPRAQVCCALYCLWARAALAGTGDPWKAACATLRALWPEGTRERTELEVHVRPDDPPSELGSGYVVSTLHSAHHVLAHQGYERVVKAAVSLGHDTDTTACVAGGIAGLRDGVGAIPVRWREGLRGQELYQPLLRALLER